MVRDKRNTNESHRLRDFEILLWLLAGSACLFFPFNSPTQKRIFVIAGLYHMVPYGTESLYSREDCSPKNH